MPQTAANRSHAERTLGALRRPQTRDQSGTTKNTLCEKAPTSTAGPRSGRMATWGRLAPQGLHRKSAPAPPQKDTIWGPGAPHRQNATLSGQKKYASQPGGRKRDKKNTHITHFRRFAPLRPLGRFCVIHILVLCFFIPFMPKVCYMDVFFIPNFPGCVICILFLCFWGAPALGSILAVWGPKLLRKKSAT